MSIPFLVGLGVVSLSKTDLFQNLYKKSPFIRIREKRPNILKPLLFTYTLKIFFRGKNISNNHLKTFRVERRRILLSEVAVSNSVSGEILSRYSHSPTTTQCERPRKLSANVMDLSGKISNQIVDSTQNK